MNRFAGMVVGLLLVASSARASEEALPTGVDAAIARISPVLSDGHAQYEGGALGVPCDTAGVPAPDIAVLFWLTGWGGGNGSRQFLAILTPLEVGGALRDGEKRPYALLGVVPIGADFDRSKSGDCVRTALELEGHTEAIDGSSLICEARVRSDPRRRDLRSV